MLNAIRRTVNTIKKNNPLILSITNHVTMDFIANGLLSIGASAIMSESKDELEDLIQISDVVLINIGTINKDFIDIANQAAKIANQMNKPIIFDPVGVGASSYRTRLALNLIENNNITILKGNASEIIALESSNYSTKGVESKYSSEEAINSAKKLCSTYGMTCLITGRTDIIMSKDQVQKFNNGTPLMTKIAGTGCLLGAITGAFHAVESDPFKASCAAVAFYSFCAEIAEAAPTSNGPTSFKTNFLDALYHGIIDYI